MSDGQGRDSEVKENEIIPKKLPKGVVLGPDGKPCRNCTSFASWAAMTKKETAQGKSSQTTIATLIPPPDCPPDVEQLGRSTWTLLHSMAAQYPVSPTVQDQRNAQQFFYSFSKLYPCWTCASDFQVWLSSNAPKVSSREDFGRWLCEAHNEVNGKLGKPIFDCGRWEERWRTGWKDGRCD